MSENNNQPAVDSGTEAASKAQARNSFWTSLKKILDDVLSLEVATYITTGDQTGEITLKVAASDSETPNQPVLYKASLQAYTKIKLDADTLALLPVTEDYTVRKEIYEIHKDHVEMAQKTRQEMVQAMLNAAASVVGFFG